LYIDGELAAQGEGVTFWPDAKVQAEQGFSIGNDVSGQATVGGAIDEFTTFGFPLSAEEIAHYYQNTRPLADLGPITPEEEAASLARLDALREQAAALRQAQMQEGGESLMSLLGYGTNDYGANLWLEIWPGTNVVHVLLHNTTTHADYRLLSSTNLPATSWLIETQLTGLQGQTEVVLNTTNRPTLLLQALELSHAPAIYWGTGGASNWMTYTLGSGAKLIDTNATGIDFDSPDFNGGRLTLTLRTNAQPEDLLAIRHQGTGSGQIGVTNSSVTFGGTVIGTWSGGSGTTPLTVDFNGNAGTNAVTALLRNLTYQYAATNPMLFERPLQFTLTDGDGETNAPTETAIRIICPQSIDAMLVLDVSGSLSTNNFKLAKEGASNFVSNLEVSSDRVGLISFAHTAVLETNLTQNFLAVQGILMGLNQRTGTLIHPPVYLAQTNLDQSPSNKLRVLLLFSDGVINNDPAVNTNLAKEAAAAAKGAGTRLITFAYGNSA
jgi:hypothetical protein